MTPRRGFLRPGLLIWLLSALSAHAAVDPAGPIVGSVDCTDVGAWIRHDQMVARLASQFGASPIETGPLVDGRMLETYYDSATGLWFQTIVRRVKTPTVWEVRPSSLTCWFGVSDPVLIPPKR